MSELFDRFRSTASKASFEAEKFRRINAVQSIVKSLYADMNKAYHDTGRLAFLVFQKGEFDQPDLIIACEELQKLQEEIIAREREIELIRQKTFEDPDLTTAAPDNLVCPNGHGPLLAGTRFCMECGTEGVVESVPTAATCGNCGAGIKADAKFCSSCGHPTDQSDRQAEQKPEPVQSQQQESVIEEPPQEHKQEPDFNICINCGVELPADAKVCPECGFTLEDPSSPAAEDDEFSWEMFTEDDFNHSNSLAKLDSGKLHIDEETGDVPEQPE